MKWNLKLKTLLILTFLIVYSILLNATVRYVSKTGSSTPPYLTWETAADSIQECIDISIFGDTIYVANGVYEEQVIMIPGLSLIGAGADSCIIDTRILATTTSFRSVQVKDTCLFKGFKIIVANNSELGGGISGSAINSLITINRITKGKYGIENGSNATIYNNIVDNISSGIYLFNSNALVRNNLIYTDPNSQSAIIAGIRIGAFDNSYNPLIDSNYIETFREGIRQSFGSDPIIKNNTIVLRHTSARGIQGGGIPDSLVISNNSIYAIEGHEGIDNNAANARTFNNHLTGNFNGRILQIYDDNVVENNVITNGTSWGVYRLGTGSFVFQYNNVWNNGINYSGFIPDSTNLSVDPIVVNEDTTQGELDFHLQKFSPLINAGDPSILDKDSSRSDIGLYGGLWGESYKYVDYPPRAPRNVNAVIDTNNNSIINISWNRNTEADFDYYNLYSDTTANFTTDTTNFVAVIEDTSYLYLVTKETDSLYFKLTGVDNQGNVSVPSEEAGVLLVTGVEDEWKPVSSFILYQNYPNPFNPATKIGYKLRERGYVKLYVYDVKGEFVSVLVNKEQEAGYYEVEFTTQTGGGKQETGIRELASGVYIYQILVKNENNIPVFSDIKKMILIK